jgi:hypothetical protein
LQAVDFPYKPPDEIKIYLLVYNKKQPDVHSLIEFRPFLSKILQRVLGRGWDFLAEIDRFGGFGHFERNNPGHKRDDEQDQADTKEHNGPDQHFFGGGWVAGHGFGHLAAQGCQGA